MTIKKKVTKKKVAKKKVTKKKPAKKKVRARARRLGPVPKYHIDHKSWDKIAVMKIICEKMMSSADGIAQVCNKNSDLPSVSMVFNWLATENRTPGEQPLLDMYRDAKDMQADFMAEEMIDIADNRALNPVVISGQPLIIDGEIVMEVDSAAVQHAKLMVDTRKWVAAKLKPRKYGDALKLTNDPESPFRDISDDELEQRIAAKLAQSEG